MSSPPPVPDAAGPSGPGVEGPAFAGRASVPPPRNDENLTYLPGSPERAALKARLAEMTGTPIEIPAVIGGRDVHSGVLHQVVMPHAHHHLLATWHAAEPQHVEEAVRAAALARREWASWSPEDRCAVFLRAAALLTGPWRATLNAATMLGQSKTVFQAEIDAASELIDFFRFNPFYAQQIYAQQPGSSPAVWNRLEYRPLEGFVYAVTPFNFTSIAGNLPTAPAMMGNTVIWKPAASAMLSAYYVLRLLEAAGLPPGVINLVPGDPEAISGALLASRELAGVHFTGSTAVFDRLWRTVGEHISGYSAYPRLVGETGGKDFIVAHASADVQALAVAIVRGAFEYQGQKCSAVSRIYVPASLWAGVRDRVVEMMRQLQVGDVADFRTFCGAVIDRKAFAKITGYIDDARANARIVQGGVARDGEGYFIEPTLVETDDPGYRLMREEIFGPVVTAFVYPDRAWPEILATVDATSPYALTGAVFATDREAVRTALAGLRYAAGNFYINDKPTGAVVGQQPFGGGRRSGTNDKAGSAMNLLRWVSARAVKETFVPPRDYRYPHMSEA
ncbi:MAG: L-glutamate gamma-semialdehyde dehydrogenase [Vicinamibacterales bacterium]